MKKLNQYQANHDLSSDKGEDGGSGLIIIIIFIGILMFSMWVWSLFM
ncbi:MAG: hypothetical protein V7749_11670 [Cocleimonas sp.]